MVIGRDIGIDLGTASVVVTLPSGNIVTREPSVVAMDRNTGRLLKVGLAAQRMLGRTPANIAAIRPVSRGVICDFDMAERLLREMIRKAGSFALLKPRLLITVPSCVTEVEERAVIDAGLQAGARKVYLMEKSVVAALGAGIDITKPEGHMVVDIGAGATDAAVVSLSGVARSVSVQRAGDAFNEGLIRFLRRRDNLLIGEATAEEVKKNIGCVFPRRESTAVEVKGRDVLSGLPGVASVSTDDLLEAYSDTSRAIVEAVRQTLETTPPELIADVSAGGITLTGGGSLLWGMDRLIEGSTNIRTRVADNAELCAAYGLSKALDWLGDMREGPLYLARRRQFQA